jgi:septal ring factor EnvC (AmiA/AmiB activator)
MQPDLLSPEKEENQPGPLVPQELSPSESSTSETSQLETHPVEEATNVAPSPAGKKHSKFHLAYLALGVLVFLLLAAFAWVGYWAYDLGTQLMNTQQQLAARQADYAKLQADYETINRTLKGENEKLNSELAQVKADLEKANTALVTAQSDLAKSQDQSKSLKTRIDKASKLAEILYSFDTIKDELGILQLDKLIRDSKNPQLLLEWNGISSEEDFRNFLSYLIFATRDSLK